MRDLLLLAKVFVVKNTLAKVTTFMQINSTRVFLWQMSWNIIHLEDVISSGGGSSCSCYLGAIVNTYIMYKITVTIPLT